MPYSDLSKVPRENIDKYLASQTSCPFCGSGDILAVDGLDMDRMAYDMYCDNCHSRWYDFCGVIGIGDDDNEYTKGDG